MPAFVGCLSGCLSGWLSVRPVDETPTLSHFWVVPHRTLLALLDTYLGFLCGAGTCINTVYVMVVHLYTVKVHTLLSK